jgi:hypothetical protein
MFMSLPEVAMRSARLGVMALLLVAAAEAAAQGYRPGSLDLAEQAPAHLLGLSSSASRAFDQEREMDLQALNAYAGKRRAAGPRAVERTGHWTLYGRLGFVNFHNQLDSNGGVQFSWRRSGPGFGGKINIGIHRRF